MAPWCTATWYDETRVCDLRERHDEREPLHRTRDALDRCVADVEQQQQHSAPTQKYVGGLAIFESMTSNLLSPTTGLAMKLEHQHTTHSIRCWARRHNYTLVLNGVGARELKAGYSTPYGPKRLWRGIPYDKINDVRHTIVASHLQSYFFPHFCLFLLLLI